MSSIKVIPLKAGSGTWPNQPLRCDVQRSKRKTLALYIRHQHVQVRCPHQASNAEVMDFVRSNQEWIEQRLLEERLLEKEALRIEKGARIFYRARELSIEFKEGRKQRVLINGDRFIIQGHKLNTQKAKLQVQDFLIDKASEYILPRARGLAGYLGVEGKIREIRLRKTKSKWGHCTSHGILQYNWLIMLAPYSIIDYMITHEVCHLVHLNHSKRYWELVESICPNYQHYIDWLKEHEHRFWFD